MHRAHGRLNDRTGRIAKTLPRFEHRLFTDYALTFDLFGSVISIGDEPVPRNELGGDRAAVYQGDGIGKNKPVFIGFRVFSDIGRFDLNVDVVGVFHNIDAPVLPATTDSYDVTVF